MGAKLREYNQATAHRLWLWNSDRRNGRDGLGCAAVWPRSPDRLDGRGDDRASMRDLGINRRGQPGIWLDLFSDDPEVARIGAMYLRIVGPVYVCFGLGLGLFFVSQGFGRGFTAMIANAVRLIVSVGAGLAAVYWFDLGTTGLFTAIACGFCIYAALTALAVVRVSPPATPAAR